MPPTRRHLLGALASGATAGVAGCMVATGPMPYTGLEVSVREPFDPDPPVTVPLSVEATLQNVETTEVAVRGVRLECFDRDRTRLASRALGTFSWERTPLPRREVVEHDSLLGTTTAYRAASAVDVTADLDEVPAWITFRVDGVDVPDADDGDDQPGFVGTARATSPPPEFSARILEYAGERPPDSPVPPGAYDREWVRMTRARSVPPDEPLLPNR